MARVFQGLQRYVSQAVNYVDQCDHFNNLLYCCFCCCFGVDKATALTVFAKLDGLKMTEGFAPIDTQTVSEDSDKEDPDDEDDSCLLDYESTTHDTNSNSSTSTDKDSGVDELSGDNDGLSGKFVVLTLEEEEELYNMIKTILDKCATHEVRDQLLIPSNSTSCILTKPNLKANKE